MESPGLYGLHNHHVITPSHNSAHDNNEFPRTAAEVPRGLPSSLPHELGGSTPDPHHTDTSHSEAPPSDQHRSRALMRINGHMADSSVFDNPVDLSSRGAASKHPHPGGDAPYNGHPHKRALHAAHQQVASHPILKREHFHEHSDLYNPHNGVHPTTQLTLSDRHGKSINY